MSESYWGLARKPFSNTPDPAFLYPSPVFEEGFARLVFDVTELRGGLSLVTGEIGCGKTMLAHALIDRLAGTPHAILSLPTPRLTPVQLLRSVGAVTSSAALPRGKDELVPALGAHLARVHANGTRPVLLVDEAQLASASLLEELRLLTNYEDRTDKHVHIVLLGQPELRDRIGSRAHLDQRVGLRYHLAPLEAGEVAAYVRHRLRVAGTSRDDLFDDGALAELGRRSGGVPRVVNNLASQALFVAALRKLRRVDTDLVASVAEDRA